MSAKVRVRFAPSPTGYLHIGNARTALFNYLYARHTGGAFVLRIEDTDVERSKREYETALVKDLRWLGLEWDEGPDVGGPFAPYRQSERLGIYNEYLNRLIGEDKAYKCYCTGDELQARRDAAMAEGRTPEYDGRCARLSREDVAQFENSGRAFTYRYRVPEKQVIVRDLVRGDVEFDTALIGDPVIMKSDGTPTFHYAVTVDDALMEITCVLRGEGHLPNAPIQVVLAEDIGFAAPEFAHMSQTLAPDGGKLSKRRGAMSLGDFREKGYLPEALVNYMALLGWSPGGNREVLSLAEAAELFEVGNLTKSAAYFDPQKFAYICRRHMQSAEGQYLARLGRAFLDKEGLAVDDEALARLVEMARERMEKLEDLPALVRQYTGRLELDADARTALQEETAAGVLTDFTVRLAAAGSVDEAAVKAAFKATQAATETKGKSLYMPVRAALTGSTSGAEILEIMPILGLEEVLSRLEGAARMTRGG